MKPYLKIKIKSLAEEARIIRHEERKTLTSRNRLSAWATVNKQQDIPTRIAEFDSLYSGLRAHRVNEVRGEARAAHVAYAFLRGKTFASVEQPGSKGLPMGRVVDLVAKYGGPWPKAVTKEKVEEWVGA